MPTLVGAREVVNGAMHWIAITIEVTGVAIISTGIVVASGVFLRDSLGPRGWAGAYRTYRANLGRAILLGLELLVAADIIGTVAVGPSFQTLWRAGGHCPDPDIPSFSLEVEIEGRWPWRRPPRGDDGALAEDRL